MSILGNPGGANGLPASYQGVFADYIAGGTIGTGDVVIFTATGTVTTTTTANSPVIAGVATENAVSGEAVNVLVHGVGLVNQPATSIASGRVLTTSTAAGKSNTCSPQAALGEVGTLGVQIVANPNAVGAYLCHINISSSRGV